MKLIDRIIFGFIAVCLGILATRAIMPGPVKANPGEVIDVNLVEIRGVPVWKIDLCWPTER